MVRPSPRLRKALRLAAWVLAVPAGIAAANCSAPILVYHRFGTTAADGMTVRTERFAAQLDYLKERGHPVVTLRAVVDCLRGTGPGLPAGAVAITVDDGHRSVYTDLLPLVRSRRIPVTLFLYPSAISNAGYAMTWDQLHEIRATGLFDFQSHSYWHPDFRREQRHLPPDEYQALVRTQLARSRKALEERLGGRVDMIAWPFGLHDDELAREAAAQGYQAGFTLERRAVRSGDDLLALPRYLIVDAVGMGEFARLLETSTRPPADHAPP